MGSALITPDLHATAREWAAAGSGWRGAGHQHDREGNGAVKVQICPERCQGHGRCYDLAPDLFGDDEEGYGQVLRRRDRGADAERHARLAVSTARARDEVT